MTNLTWFNFNVINVSKYNKYNQFFSNKTLIKKLLFRCKLLSSIIQFFKSTIS